MKTPNQKVTLHPEWLSDVFRAYRAATALAQHEVVFEHEFDRVLFVQRCKKAAREVLSPKTIDRAVLPKRETRVLKIPAVTSGLNQHAPKSTRKFA